MKVLIIIPARGGSKRLIGKNSRLINGKALFLYSVKAAKEIKYKPRIIVSTDDEKIKNICKSNSIEYQNRYPYLALDYAAKQDVIVDVCNELWEKEFYQPDIVISLQANSPQVNSNIINNGLEEFISRKEKNGWKEVICIDSNGIQNGAIRIMTYRTVYQRTLSTYLSTFTENLLDIHTQKDLDLASKEMGK